MSLLKNAVAIICGSVDDNLCPKQRHKSVFVSGKKRHTLFISLIILLFIISSSLFAVPPGTVITNIAQGSYTLGNQTDINTLSNIVTTITVIPQTTSMVEFYTFDPNNSAMQLTTVSTTWYSLSGLSSGTFVSMNDPHTLGNGQTIDINSPVPLSDADSYFSGEAVFIRLRDTDQNIDTTLAESILVTIYTDTNGEIEVLRLYETDINSGIFTGYVQSSGTGPVVAYDGSLNVTSALSIYVDYVDRYDAMDITSDTANIINYTGDLFLNKSVNKQVASIGDFVLYKLNLENINALRLTDVTVRDLLPYGFRYKPGSARIDGVQTNDPQISPDNQTIYFNLASLDGRGTVEIQYVIEITPQTKPGIRTNLAEAYTPFDERSNIARASVKVSDDLLTLKNIIIGQVSVTACTIMDTLEIGNGIKGVRIYLEDGTFTVTDDNGMYHFEGIEPGTHVVQLDSSSLTEKYEISPCENSYQLYDRPYSQFVDMKPGMIWRADFSLKRKPDPPPPSGEFNYALSSQLVDSLIEISFNLENSDIPLEYLRLTLMLPEEGEYVAGSSTINDTAVDDPKIYGQILAYTIDSMNIGETHDLKLYIRTNGRQQSGELVLSGIIMFDTPTERNVTTEKIDNILSLEYEQEIIRQPEIVLRPKFASFSSDLSDGFKALLDEVIKKYKDEKIVEIYVSGHSDSIPISKRSRHIFPDNYALSLERARSVGNHLARTLDVDMSRILLAGKGPDVPVESNSTDQGRFLNRRVEVEIVVERLKDIYHLGIVEEKQIVICETEGILIDSSIQHVYNHEDKQDVMPDYNQTALNKMRPGREWVWPEDDYFPPIPTTKLAIKHYPDEAVHLFLNDKPVSNLNYVGTVTDDSSTVALTIFSGVDLHEGFNRFDALLENPETGEVNKISKFVYYSSSAVNASLIDSLSYTIADGRNPIVLAVQLTDVNGYPARTGVIGEFKVDQPYHSYRETDLLKKQSPTEQNNRQATYVISRDGIAFIKLEPTSHVGEAVLHFNLVDNEKDIRCWLKPEEREMILVGLVEGMIGFNDVKGNLETLEASGIDDKYYDDGRIAFFARGRIKGKWLLTASADTDNIENDSLGSLFGMIDPDKYYTLYGDASRQQYDAPSSEKIYIKVERDRFYAMFGDYNSSMTVTQLSRYNRSLTGFKSEYHNSRFNTGWFVSKSNQSYIKDEIRGDGTSGLYHLSNNSIVMNSDKLSIETRERFRSEIILSKKELRRHLDYSIDYIDGTIFFKEPIPAQDLSFNPIYIVAEYEAVNQSQTDYNIGGRTAYRFLDQKMEIGGSFIHEGQTTADGNLGGLDFKYKINPNIEIKSELAASRALHNNQKVSGTAFLTEITNRFGQYSTKFYLRYLEQGFGLGQQNQSETGSRKLGFDLERHLNKKYSFRARTFRQYNLGSEARRDLIETQFNYNYDKYTAQTGFIYARDRLPGDLIQSSTQMTFGGSYKMMDGKLRLRLDRQQSLGGSNDNQAFPTRTSLGLEYQPTQPITVFVSQEFTDGAQTNTIDTRFGIRSKLWDGSQLHSSIERHFTNDAVRVFSNLGLKQTWRLDNKWSIDAALDLSHTIGEPETQQFDDNLQPLSTTVEDYTALSLGFGYRGNDWSWSNRVERRDGESQDKWGIITGLYGEPSEGLGMSVGSQIFLQDHSNKTSHNLGKIQLGLAVRRLHSDWTWLDRLDYIFEKRSDSLATFDKKHLVNYMHLNYTPHRKYQITLMYNMKYVHDYIDGQHYESFSDQSGVESRFYFHDRWDIGLHGSLRHSWKNNLYDYSSGLSLGYNAFKNSWISLGYNINGYHDEDFSSSNYTARGPYLKVRIKFDQQTAKEIIKLIESM